MIINNKFFLDYFVYVVNDKITDIELDEERNKFTIITNNFHYLFSEKNKRVFLERTIITNELFNKISRNSFMRLKIENQEHMMIVNKFKKEEIDLFIIERENEELSKILKSTEKKKRSRL